MFAFVGAKGGVGTTTMAVNVATALAKLSPAGALLIDLHLATATRRSSSARNRASRSLDALENLHRLDSAFFRSLLVKTQPGLDLLAPRTALLTRAWTSAGCDRHRVCVQLSTPTPLLDVPRSDIAVLDSLDHARDDRRGGEPGTGNGPKRRPHGGGAAARYGKSKVMTVINRTDRRSEIGQQDIERAVGSSIAHQFPSDYRRALHAMNKGRPLVLDNHNDLSASFTALARELAGIDEKPNGPEVRGGLLGLFAGRKG